MTYHLRFIRLQNNGNPEHSETPDFDVPKNELWEFLGVDTEDAIFLVRKINPDTEHGGYIKKGCGG